MYVLVLSIGWLHVVGLPASTCHPHLCSAGAGSAFCHLSLSCSCCCWWWSSDALNHPSIVWSSHAPAAAGDPVMLFIIQVPFVIFGTSLLYEEVHKEYAKKCVNSQQNSTDVFGVLVGAFSIGMVCLKQTLNYPWKRQSTFVFSMLKSRPAWKSTLLPVVRVVTVVTNIIFTKYSDVSHHANYCDNSNHSTTQLVMKKRTLIYPNVEKMLPS